MTESCGIHLKDVVGSDNKLNDFINTNILNPDLLTVPKIGPNTAKELKRKGIKTTNDLIGKFLTLRCDYVECLQWLGATVSFTQSKQIVSVVFYRMEMMGFVIPKLPDDWVKLDRHGNRPE